MKIYTNEKGEIKDVNSTEDSSLIEYDLIDATNPFLNWSVAKICCYKVTVFNGIVTMMTPYVDSRLIEHIDQLGQQVEAVTPWTASKTAYIRETSIIFDNVPSGNLTVYCDVPYHMDRNGDQVSISFDPLDKVIDVAISVLKEE